MSKRTRKGWNAWKRAKLFQENPHCYWCGRLTQLVTRERGQRPPADMATIDHLRPRSDPTRREIPRPGEKRLVNACYECNNRRDKEMTAALPIEELRERSGYYRRMGAA